jgi:uncharacterized YigZ family protein
MEDSYKTLKQPAEGLFRDRNSRFLAFGFPVENPPQANEILAGIRKKYHDARHHCYAWRIGVKPENTRMNDDGEPSGTAGKPIYNQIVSHNLTGVLVIVVRYFGGTLLGTGGLINAYKTATADMLSKAVVIEKFLESSYRLSFPYEKLSAVMKLLKEESLVPLEPVYEAACTMNVSVRQSMSNLLLERLSVIGGIKTETLQTED